MDGFEWVSPYVAKRHWPFGWEVIFEEDTKLAWLASEYNAKRYAAQLNGAYNLGRASVRIEVELQQEANHGTHKHEG